MIKTWKLLIIYFYYGVITCRACSFLVANFDVTRNERRLEQANHFNRMRGPDATNIRKIHDWTFLHNLLSMTGEFTLQPFVDDEKGEDNIVALFNGEIYNYLELAEELSLTDVKSDGQLLLPAYEKWGTQFIEHFQGEFAIVVVDFVKDIVILSTDVFSTKPLWYGMWPCREEEGVVVETTCFAAASYESVLKVLGAPKSARKMADPNKVLVLSRDDFTRISLEPMFQFDLNQHKTSTKDWEKAFIQAVKIRTDRIKHKIFIGLSAGFDSGAIMLALEILKKPFFAYHVVTKEAEKESVLRERVNYATHANASIIQLDEAAFKERKNWLRKNCEPFKYKHKEYKEGDYFTYDDKASVGLSVILTKVRKLGGLIYLTGGGADETISDYGMNGKRIFKHSCFAGVFPEDLKSIFPWCSFYNGTQRSYIMKEEITGGAHGIETRYPFLDPLVVQEYLWLTADVKNSEYKRPIADFLRHYRFPNMYGIKQGFSVTAYKSPFETEIDHNPESPQKFMGIRESNEVNTDSAFLFRIQTFVTLMALMAILIALLKSRTTRWKVSSVLRRLVPRRTLVVRAAAEGRHGIYPEHKLC